MKVDWKSCVRIGISVFLLYLCVTYWPAFIDLLHNLLQAATPLLLGCVLAYAINILMSFYETHYFPKSANPALKKSRRPVCMLAAFLTLAVLLIFIVKLVIPELVSCIKLLAGQVPAAINDLLAWLETQNIVPETILASLQTVDWRAKTQQIIGFLTSGISSVMGVAVSAAVSVFSGAVTLLLAVIFSIYLLSGKEKLGNQFHRLMLRYVKPDIDAKMRYILLQYIWTGKPGSQSGFPSISCLSYNERSNWLTITSLGFYVRRKDCQSSSCCSVRFEQVEPPDAGEFASHNRLNRQREKMDSGCRFLVLEECE